jgi:hypothetical protein
MRRENEFPALLGRGALALAVISIVLAAAGVAMALGALRTESKSTKVARYPDSGTVSAKCDRGSEAVSGGFDNPDFEVPFNVNPAIFNYSSHRSSTRKWAVSGKNSGESSGKLVGYAYCDRHEPGLKTRSKTVDVTAEAETKAVATCRRGSEAVSGGLLSDDPTPEFNPYRSIRRGDRKWVVKVHEFPPESPTLTAVVYCDKQEPGLRTKSKDASVDPGVANTATAKCPRGTEAVSGGFDNPDYTDPTGTGPAIYPYESRRVKTNKWRVSGWNDGASQPGTLTAFVYCKR